MITAPRLAVLSGLRHGFATRRGGVSGGIYASLNCGFGSKDDRAAVAENRARAAARLGRGEAPLLTCFQEHTSLVVTVREPWTPEASPVADALVTDRPGWVLGVLTADCAPVLLADAQAGVIGAAHAGWKGALGGVLESTVAAMEDLGAQRGRIVAAVGPCIHPASYEVSPEFTSPFLAQDPANARFFFPAKINDKRSFDLPGYVAARLSAFGLAGVDRSEQDTYAEETLFFSFRRATHRGEPVYGRQVSMIALDGEAAP